MQLVPVSVFITCTGAVSGYTTLPADYKFPVFLLFSGEKIITLLGDCGLSEAVRKKGTNDSQQRRTGTAVCSKEKKRKVSD